MGNRQYGIDPDRFAEYAQEIKTRVEKGVEVAFVIGGGNIFRGVAVVNKGIDLNAIDDEIDKKEEQLEELAKNHTLSVQSMAYSNLVRKWFDENETSLEKITQEINQSIKLGTANEDTILEFETIKDVLEIIRWYSFQIHVKLMRALRHGKPDLDFEDAVQNDANGSAKVALIGTERSLGAWGVLHRQLPEQEDEILELLLLLEKIRKGIFKKFPEVNSFKRPGFDDN